MPKNERLRLEQGLLEYCRVPRNLSEIKAFLGLSSTTDSVRRHFVSPLVKARKLKCTQGYLAAANQRYINAEVEVTEDMLISIRRDSETTRMRESMILEFCKVPRSIREIREHVGTTAAIIYVKPLMDEGKLKYTMPHIPSYLNQKYINAEMEYEPLSEQSIIEFCKTPRTKKEIAEHFSMTLSIRRTMLQKLIEQDKLRYTNESVELHEYDGNRRLTSSFDWNIPFRVPKKKLIEVKRLNTISNKTGFTIEQELLEYCKKPRTIYQLIEFLGTNTKITTTEKFIAPLMKQGRIKFIYPDSPSSNYQRYLNTEIEFTAEMEAEINQERKTEQEIELELRALEFCKEPKSSGELMKHLELNDYASVMRVIKPLMAEGKIRFKYSHDPHYLNQRYVIAEWQHFPAPFIEENVLEFCKIPRFKYEISEHFEIGKYACNDLINKLVEKSKLKYIKYDTIKNIPHGMLIKNG